MEQRIENNNSKKLFNDKQFYKYLLVIALPTILQNFIASSLNMVDTLLIGMVGETEIAAVGIANQYYFLFNLIIIGLYGGCSVFISQFWGKKDEKNIKKVVGFGVVSGTVVALIFTIIAFIIPEKVISIFNTDPKVVHLGAMYLKTVCISYWFTAMTFNYSFASRSIHNTMLPLIVSSCALAVNTFLNYVLIFGKFGAPQLGVVGSALATVIARTLEATILIGYIYMTKGLLAGNVKELLTQSKEFVINISKTVSAVLLNDACWGLGAVVYSIAYGRIGTQAMASVQICNTISNLFMVIVFGIANASCIMVGNKIGECNKKSAKDYGKRFCYLGILIGIVIGTALWVFAPNVLSLFTVSYKVKHDALIILYVISAIMIIKTLNIILVVGILRGGGDAKFCLFTEGFTMWCIGVPLTFMGAFLWGFPIYIVVSFTAAEEIMKLIIAMHRMISYKWIKNLVCNIE